MTIKELESRLHDLARECDGSKIAFIGTAVQLDHEKAPDDAITVCQVLSDKSGCLPLAELCSEAAARLKQASPNRRVRQA